MYCVSWMEAACRFGDAFLCSASEFKSAPICTISGGQNVIKLMLNLLLNFQRFWSQFVLFPWRSPLFLCFPRNRNPQFLWEQTDLLPSVIPSTSTSLLMASIFATPLIVDQDLCLSMSVSPAEDNFEVCFQTVRFGVFHAKVSVSHQQSRTLVLEAVIAVASVMLSRWQRWKSTGHFCRHLLPCSLV